MRNKLLVGISGHAGNLLVLLPVLILFFVAIFLGSYGLLYVLDNLFTYFSFFRDEEIHTFQNSLMTTIFLLLYLKQTSLDSNTEEWLESNLDLIITKIDEKNDG